MATELVGHVTHGETKQGVEQFYAATAITADDVAQIIAFAVSQPRTCRSTRSSFARPRRPSDDASPHGKDHLTACAAASPPPPRRSRSPRSPPAVQAACCELLLEALVVDREVHEPHICRPSSRNLGLVVPVDKREDDRDIGLLVADRIQGGSELVAEDEADRQGRLTGGDVVDPPASRFGSGQQRSRLVEELRPSEVQLLGDGDEVAQLPQVQRRARLQTHARRASPVLEEVLSGAANAATCLA